MHRFLAVIEPDIGSVIMGISARMIVSQMRDLFRHQCEQSEYRIDMQQLVNDLVSIRLPAQILSRVLGAYVHGHKFEQLALVSPGYDTVKYDITLIDDEYIRIGFRSHSYVVGRFTDVIHIYGEANDGIFMLDSATRDLTQTRSWHPFFIENLKVWSKTK